LGPGAIRGQAEPVRQGPLPAQRPRDPSGRVRPRRLPMPVLRRARRVDRSRDAPVQGRGPRLGERGGGLSGLQPPEGEPDAGGGRVRPSHQADATETLRLDLRGHGVPGRSGLDTVPPARVGLTPTPTSWGTDPWLPPLSRFVPLSDSEGGRSLPPNEVRREVGGSRSHPFVPLSDSEGGRGPRCAAVSPVCPLSDSEGGRSLPPNGVRREVGGSRSNQPGVSRGDSATP